MAKSKPPVVLIVGPTAVGKTEIAIELAERIDGEIISADSRLFYRGMDIGTAKPSAEARARIPHYLVDIANPDETLSLPVFQKLAHAAIEDIQARGKFPLLVGGTGQYIRAVTQGWTPPEVKPNSKLRDEIEKIAIQHRGRMDGDLEASAPSRLGQDEKDWLYGRLKSLDPEAANNIDARNVRRTIRALEVIFTTGMKFSEQRGHGDILYDVLMIGLIRPRAELYKRIDDRIEAMFESGFLNEVKALLDQGYSADLPTMSAIGYRETIQVLRGIWSMDEAKSAMRRATRAFVRRQANWFKETDPNIKWFTVQNGIEKEIEVYIKAHTLLS